MVAIVFFPGGRPHLANHPPRPPTPVHICSLLPDPLPPNVRTPFMDGPISKREAIKLIQVNNFQYKLLIHSFLADSTSVAKSTC